MSKTVFLDLKGLKEVSRLPEKDLEKYHRLATASGKKGVFVQNKQTSKVYLMIVESAKVVLYRSLIGPERLLETMEWGDRSALGYHQVYDTPGNDRSTYLADSEITFTEMVENFETTESKDSIEVFEAVYLFNSLLVLRDGEELILATAKRFTARNEFLKFNDLVLDTKLFEQKNAEIEPRVRLAYNMAGGKVQESVHFDLGEYAAELTLAMNQKKQSLLASKRGISVRWIHTWKSISSSTGQTTSTVYYSYRLVLIKK